MSDVVEAPKCGICGGPLRAGAVLVEETQCLQRGCGESLRACETCSKEPAARIKLVTRHYCKTATPKVQA